MLSSEFDFALVLALRQVTGAVGHSDTWLTAANPTANAVSDAGAGLASRFPLAPPKMLAIDEQCDAG